MFLPVDNMSVHIVYNIKTNSTEHIIETSGGEFAMSYTRTCVGQQMHG